MKYTAKLLAAAAVLAGATLIGYAQNGNGNAGTACPAANSASCPAKAGANCPAAKSQCPAASDKCAKSAADTKACVKTKKAKKDKGYKNKRTE